MGMVFLDGDTECSLSELLVFFSGTNRVPPTGFVEQPALIFVHQGAAKFPTASTCDRHLRLLPATRIILILKTPCCWGLKAMMDLGAYELHGIVCVCLLNKQFFFALH